MVHRRCVEAETSGQWSTTSLTSTATSAIIHALVPVAPTSSRCLVFTYSSPYFFFFLPDLCHVNMIWWPCENIKKVMTGASSTMAVSVRMH